MIARTQGPALSCVLIENLKILREAVNSGNLPDPPKEMLARLMLGVKSR